MKIKPKGKITWVKLPTMDSLELSERLLQEVEGVHNLFFHLSLDGLPTKLNPLIPNYSMAVREMIRHAALQKYGLDWSKWYNPAREKNYNSANFLKGIVIGRGSNNKIIFNGELNNSPDRQHVKTLLLKPILRAYKWHDVAYWNLGLVDTLKTTPSGCLALINAGVFLFKDEIQKLYLGEVVTPKYWGGFNGIGIVENKLDTYQIRNEQLFRVWAHLLD